MPFPCPPLTHHLPWLHCAPRLSQQVTDSSPTLLNASPWFRWIWNGEKAVDWRETWEAVRCLHRSLQPMLMCLQGPSTGQVWYKRAELQDLWDPARTALPFAFCQLRFCLHSKKFKRAWVEVNSPPLPEVMAYYSPPSLSQFDLSLRTVVLI